jgi:hypothetical protein
MLCSSNELAKVCVAVPICTPLVGGNEGGGRGVGGEGETKERAFERLLTPRDIVPLKKAAREAETAVCSTLYDFMLQAVRRHLAVLSRGYIATGADLCQS